MKKHFVKHVVVVFLISTICTNCSAGFLKNCGHFLSVFTKEHKNVGSVVPSSRFLTNAITRHVYKGNRSIRVLEVGVGTGAIAEKVIEKISDDDVFDIIEKDPNVCDAMRKKFAQYKNVHVYCCKVLDWYPVYEYDYIVSALPFNSFSAQMVDMILEKFRRMIKYNGVVSYVELLAVSRIKKRILRGEKKQDFTKNLQNRARFEQAFAFDKDIIMLNMPPVRVYHLKVRK